MNKESPSDLSLDETPGHQGVKNTGGNKAYLRVLHCNNMDFYSKLGGYTVNSFTLRTRLFDVRNLKDDSFDYFPKDDSQDFVERKAPMPVWFVATYDEKENYVKATDTLHRALNDIPSRSSKPFQVRLNEDVADTNLKSQRIQKVEHSEIPPWLVPEVCV